MNLDKPRFGIISGAGPMAGVILYQHIISLLQSKGAYHDDDFPEIIIYNVPFKEMLDGNSHNPEVTQQLDNALSYLAQSVDINYIACQTLHLFLPPERLQALKVRSLMTLIDEATKDSTETIAIVASITSSTNALHTNVLSTACEYIEKELSQIGLEAVLKGEKPNLEWIYKESLKRPVLLGCTEFSVALKDEDWDLICPLKLAADDLVNRYLCLI